MKTISISIIIIVCFFRRRLNGYLALMGTWPSREIHMLQNCTIWGGVLMSVGDFPERLSQAILAGIILVGRLAVLGTWLNGYLALQGNTRFIIIRIAESKHVLKLVARKRLGTRWAKYPFSWCRLLFLERPFLCSHAYRWNSNMLFISTLKWKLCC